MNTALTLTRGIFYYYTTTTTLFPVVPSPRTAAFWPSSESCVWPSEKWLIVLSS